MGPGPGRRRPGHLEEILRPSGDQLGLKASRCAENGASVLAAPPAVSAPIPRSNTPGSPSTACHCVNAIVPSAGETSGAVWIVVSSVSRVSPEPSGAIA